MPRCKPVSCHKKHCKKHCKKPCYKPKKSCSTPSGVYNKLRVKKRLTVCGDAKFKGCVRADDVCAKAFHSEMSCVSQVLAMPGCPCDKDTMGSAREEPIIKVMDNIGLEKTLIVGTVDGTLDESESATRGPPVIKTKFVQNICCEKSITARSICAKADPCDNANVAATEALPPGTICADKIIAGELVLADECLDINGDLCVDGKINATDLCLSGDLDVKGETLMHDKLTVTSCVSIDGCVDVGGDLCLEGSLHVEDTACLNEANVCGDVEVHGDGLFNNNVCVSGNIKLGETTLTEAQLQALLALLP